MPFKGGGVVPFEGFDIERAAGVLFQGFGGAERTHGGGDVMVPGAGIGIIFLVIKSVIGADAQAGLGAEERNAVDLAAGGGYVLFKAPAQTAKEIQLALFGMV